MIPNPSIPIPHIAMVSIFSHAKRFSNISTHVSIGVCDLVNVTFMLEAKAITFIMPLEDYTSEYNHHFELLLNKIKRIINKLKNDVFVV